MNAIGRKGEAAAVGVIGVAIPAAPHEGATAGPDPFAGGKPPSRPSRRRQAVLLAVLAAVTAALVVLAFRYGLSRRMDVVRLERADLAIELRGPATLDAEISVSLASRIQGQLTTVHVGRNDSVRRGAPIAEIAASDLDSQLAAAAASATAARRAVEQAVADRDRAEAVLENARATRARQEALLKFGTATHAAYESAVAAAAQAEADLVRAQAMIEQASAEQASAEAMVRFNRTKLDDARITAPFSGVIVERSRNAGDVVTPGAEIARLVDPASIFLSARFDESAMGKVAPGQDVQLTFVSDPDTVIAGKVLRVGRQVDSETREFAVDIAPVSLPPNWAIGQRGTAAIAVAKRISVLSVPAPAIVWKDGEPGAWFVRHGRAAWRRLVLGEIATGNRMVVRDGALEGDLVVARPVGVYSGLRIDAGAETP